MSRLDSSDSKSRAKATLEALEPRQLLANVTAGFTDSVFASGLTRPTAMTFASDGRIFVSLQDGQIRVVKNGQLLSTPALKLNVSKAGERGVLGSAFDPNFNTNHYFYLYYTARSSGGAVIERHREASIEDGQPSQQGLAADGSAVVARKIGQ